jgi:Ca2+-binding RTX toxin-like protein
MARAEALTRGLLDVSDDFSDLMHRQFWLLDEPGHHHDHHDDDHLQVDATFTVGRDEIDGDAGHDVLIGDDSVLVEPAFIVSVGQAGNFERFAEGLSDAGDELAHAVIDLNHLEQELRDEVVSVEVGKYWHDHVEQHTDVVLLGNDTLRGGDGNDLIVGDDFVTRAPAVTIVAGGAPDRGHDDDWQDDDWKDRWDWWDHHDHDDWHHGHDHWHVAGLKIGADVIDGGSDDDLVYGDSLAIVTATVTRGAGVTSKDFYAVDGDAEDAIERFAVLTDGAEYWLAQQGHHHHDDWDDDPWGFDNGDDIAGGAGNDILFGQAGNDNVRGEAGDDWVIGGSGNDTADGGPGWDNVRAGSDESKALRSAVASRMIDWQDSFKYYGLPFAPFGCLAPGKGVTQSNIASFDFLSIDPARRYDE